MKNCKRTIITTEEKGNVLGQCYTIIKPIEVDNRNGIECPVGCNKTNCIHGFDNCNY